MKNRTFIESVNKKNLILNYKKIFDKKPTEPLDMTSFFFLKLKKQKIILKKRFAFLFRAFFGVKI